MATKKKLNRGLDAIFGSDIDSFLQDIEKGNSKEFGSGQQSIPIKDIRANPYQPRKQFDEASLNELADSIRENGVFQPILVRKSKTLKGYELVAGERRLRASKLAGKKNIPAIIVDFSEAQMMEISLLENIQRKDLTPIEQATAYDQLIKKLNYTQDELAKRLGKSRTNITNLLRLLNLPNEVKKLVNANKLSYGQARTLLALDDEDEMVALAKRAVKEDLSVRELEGLTSSNKKTTKKPTNSKPRDPFMEDVKNRLQRKYSTKVEIKNKSIIIKYNDIKDLNRILEIMGVIED